LLGAFKKQIKKDSVSLTPRSRQKMTSSVIHLFILVLTENY
jgi:hypothetical protein